MPSTTVDILRFFAARSVASSSACSAAASDDLVFLFVPLGIVEATFSFFAPISFLTGAAFLPKSFLRKAGERFVMAGWSGISTTTSILRSGPRCHLKFFASVE